VIAMIKCTHIFSYIYSHVPVYTVHANKLPIKNDVKTKSSKQHCHKYYSMRPKIP
jgi:hypothetical protein